MVFDSVARYHQELQVEDGVEASQLPHVVISNMEHDSVDLTARKMAEQGRIGMYAWWFFLLLVGVQFSPQAPPCPFVFVATAYHCCALLHSSTS